MSCGEVYGEAGCLGPRTFGFCAGAEGEPGVGFAVSVGLAGESGVSAVEYVEGRAGSVGWPGGPFFAVLAVSEVGVFEGALVSVPVAEDERHGCPVVVVAVVVFEVVLVCLRVVVALAAGAVVDDHGRVLRAGCRNVGT